MSNPPEKTSPNATANATDTQSARPPKGFLSRIWIRQLGSAIVIISAISGGAVWVTNKMIDYGRTLEQTEQLKRDTAELISVKDQLKTMQQANEQINDQLKALTKEKEELLRERTGLVSRADKLQDELLILSKQLTANDNCSFVHRQIEAAQRAVDQHRPFTISSQGPDSDYLREHQILIDRLQEYQNQLGRCRGTPEPVR